MDSKDKQKMKNEKIKKLSKRLDRYMSAERLILMRNLSYGAAATSLIILVCLVKVGVKEFPLRICMYGVAIALPLWFVLGGFYEMYIFLGKKSFPHLQTRFSQYFVQLVVLTAGIALVTAVGSLFFYLSPAAAYAFGLTALLGFWLVLKSWESLALWWFRDDGPGSRDEVDEQIEKSQLQTKHHHN
jgi:cobalamin synthase